MRLRQIHPTPPFKSPDEASRWPEGRKTRKSVYWKLREEEEEESLFKAKAMKVVTRLERRQDGEAQLNAKFVRYK
jgi:hypothetical protein